MPGKKLRYFHVDAFAARPFAGNPAGVVPLDRWLPAARLQQIAAENRHSETAFLLRRRDGDYDLRWFTPACEVDLCGHATLAAAWVIRHRLERRARRLGFHTRSGLLVAEPEGARLVLDFPARPGRPVLVTDAIRRALGGVEPLALLQARDYLAVLPDEAALRAVRPDFAAVRALTEALGVIVTAPGEKHDFVSRFFAPLAGVDEDPVTGSSHCTLVPYWAERLGKKRLRAFQASPRGGALACELRDGRVRMGGTAVPYLEGVITL